MDNLEKIYTQASEWIRMCNHITWAMGTFLVPLSIAAMGVALERPDYRFFLAPASVFVFLLWVYVSRLYRASAASARQVLMAIEREWGVNEQLAFYNTHGQVGLTRYGLFSTQVLCLAVLVSVWIVLLMLLNGNEATRHVTVIMK
jgi:hypothetical protein